MCSLGKAGTVYLRSFSYISVLEILPRLNNIIYSLRAVDFILKGYFISAAFNSNNKLI